MNLSYYRLKEYKIIESSANDLWWQSHYGFGEFREGKCFRKGSIIFLGRAEEIGDGFLKGEFIDNLKSIPQWEKTVYYSRHFALYFCLTGRALSEKDMRSWIGDHKTQSPKENVNESHSQNTKRFKSADRTDIQHYRLGNYEIIFYGKRKIFWKQFVKRKMIRCGRGYILEDILFLTHTSEKDYADQILYNKTLSQLPIWDRTTYYAINTTLIECMPHNNPTDFSRNRWRPAHQFPEEMRKQLSDVYRSVASKLIGLNATGLIARVKTAGKHVTAFLNSSVILLMQLAIGCGKILKRKWPKMAWRKIFSMTKRSEHGHD